jgi:Uma2 family endonuclease
LRAYHDIESLEAYMIVWRDEMRVPFHYRAEERRWFHTIYGRNDTVHIPCLDLEVSLAEIYEGVEPAA